MGIVVSLAVAGAIFQNRAIANVMHVLPNVDTTERNYRYRQRLSEHSFRQQTEEGW